MIFYFGDTLRMLRCTFDSALRHSDTPGNGWGTINDAKGQTQGSYVQGTVHIHISTVLSSSQEKYLIIC